MSELIMHLSLAGAGGLLVGLMVAWLVRGGKAAQEMETAEGNWQRKLDQVVNKARVLDDQTTSLKVNLENTQRLALQSKHAAVSTSTELESLKEKLKSLAKELSAARAERDEYASRASQQQRFVMAAKKRVDEVSGEFAKSRDFYKAQLGNAIEQRHALERKIDALNSEQASLTSLLTAAKSEQDSLNRMLSSSRSRLENLDELESKAIALEADNAELRHQVQTAERETVALRRDIAEMNDLRSQNRELSRCLESMETSRRQYESDAQRYRDQFQQSEKESETLRMKLGDIEQSLSEMQNQHEKAQEITRIPRVGVEAPTEGEGDDLTQIVGIGKVFESMLHKLGIYYFRQIATFGPTELARVNAELKEFKGRIEHDDWIGQARELHHKKYGMKGQVASVN